MIKIEPFDMIILSQDLITFLYYYTYISFFEMYLQIAFKFIEIYFNKEQEKKIKMSSI
jgi:hypothetical protein